MTGTSSKPSTVISSRKSSGLLLSARDALVLASRGEDRRFKPGDRGTVSEWDPLPSLEKLVKPKLVLLGVGSLSLRNGSSPPWESGLLAGLETTPDLVLECGRSSLRPAADEEENGGGMSDRNPPCTRPIGSGFDSWWNCFDDTFLMSSSVPFTAEFRTLSL